MRVHCSRCKKDFASVSDLTFYFENAQLAVERDVLLKLLDSKRVFLDTDSGCNKFKPFRVYCPCGYTLGIVMDLNHFETDKPEHFAFMVKALFVHFSELESIMYMRGWREIKKVADMDGLGDGEKLDSKELAICIRSRCSCGHGPKKGNKQESISDKERINALLALGSKQFALEKSVILPKSNKIPIIGKKIDNDKCDSFGSFLKKFG
eukprot:TRINITY_DN781866_c0_g1_i1.p1 TRINITY_DN781866_c0_g1~~TRINITY_DN781866_c0_g1_i1.p1  ORF type:complete len:208 (-),score=32.60 TRINITY_DN781866_c0_g1_i1:209-832(-)